MIALIQRVDRASVEVDARNVAAVGHGLLALVCAERGDGLREAEAIVDRMLGYRVFGDDRARMNRSLRDTGGGLLLVPQFTLAADTASGTRPSFTPAAPPEEARRLFEHARATAAARHPIVAAGVFGAHMKVALVNDGPVTFWLRVAPATSRAGASRAAEARAGDARVDDARAGDARAADERAGGTRDGG